MLLRILFEQNLMVTERLTDWGVWHYCPGMTNITLQVIHCRITMVIHSALKIATMLIIIEVAVARWTAMEPGGTTVASTQTWMVNIYQKEPEVFEELFGTTGNSICTHWGKLRSKWDRINFEPESDSFCSAFWSNFKIVMWRYFQINILN